MIKKYRTKPVEIEAVQWTGENAKEIKEFSELVDIEKLKLGEYICITKEGEVFICSSETFNNRYEEIKPTKSEAEYMTCPICENYRPSPYLDNSFCLAKEDTILYRPTYRDEKDSCGKFKTKEGYRME